MKAHEFAKAFASLPEDAEVIVSSGRLSILHNGRSFPVLDISGHEQNASFPNKIERAVQGVKDWAGLNGKIAEAKRADAAKASYEAKKPAATTDPAPETA